MSQTVGGWEYSNLPSRPPGQLLRIAGLVLPGVRSVQRQVGPFAEFWAGSNRAALAADGPLWVALGDSMTQGIGASRPESGWVGRLGRRLADQGRAHRLINLSASGARVQDVTDRQLPVLLALPDRPALVTVLIGSNDLTGRPASRRGFRARAAELLDRLPAGSIVANLPNPTATAAELDAEIRRTVAERGLVLADMRRSGPGSWRGKVAADHFHPNDRGYADLAAVFAEAIDRAQQLQSQQLQQSQQPSQPSQSGQPEQSHP